MQIRGLKNKEELNNLFIMYGKVFKKTPMSYFKNRIANDPYLKLEDIRVAVDCNKIVSSIIVYRRKMYWGDEVISFGGVGNVSTLFEYRGRGLSTKILNDSFEYMKRLGFPITILYAGINGFYERLGFKTISGSFLKFIINEEPSLLEYTIRDFQQSDLSEVEELYVRFNKNRQGTVLRDSEYWKTNLAFAEKDERFIVALKNNKIVAYIRFVPNYEKGEIFEFAYYNANAFSELLFYAAKLLNKKEITTSAIYKGQISDIKDVSTMSFPTQIAMYRDLNQNNNETYKNFENYCFWWTDNF